MRAGVFASGARCEQCVQGAVLVAGRTPGAPTPTVSVCGRMGGVEARHQEEGGGGEAVAEGRGGPAEGEEGLGVALVQQALRHQGPLQPAAYIYVYIYIFPNIHLMLYIAYISWCPPAQGPASACREGGVVVGGGRVI